MINAPHSSLQAIMTRIIDAKEIPETQLERVRVIAQSLLEQTASDVPHLFFSIDKEEDVREGLDDFIMQAAGSKTPLNGEIKQQASILSHRVFEAHHATAAEERARIEENLKSYPPRSSSSTDSM